MNINEWVRKATVKSMVSAVKLHALNNYDKGGWDVIVECYTDEEIASELGRCRTDKGAIRKIGEMIGHYASYRKDIEGSAF